ncbi:MAG: tetratricopeptide repeat protein [Terriglobia bacterium]
MRILTPAARGAVQCGFLVIFTAALFASALLAARPAPLSEDQIAGLLRGGVASERIADLVKARGVSFPVSSRVLQALREDGAQSVLLRQLEQPSARSTAPDAMPRRDPGPASQALQYRNKGEDLLRRGLLSASEAALRKSVDLSPIDAAAHFYLGQALSEEGRAEGAIAQYREAILLAPDSAPARFDLGNELVKKRDYQGAIAEYREALTLEPADARAHYALGRALYEAGSDSEAAAELHEALRLDPESEESHLALGLVLARHKDMNGAIRQYELALKTAPGDAAAHADLSFALLAKGDSKAAIDQMRAAALLAPDDLSYQASYRKLTSRGDPSEAR